jgi:hypothetical protein
LIQGLVGIAQLPRIASFIKGHFVVVKADWRVGDPVGRINDEVRPYIELPYGGIADFNRRLQRGPFNGDFDRIAFGQNQGWNTNRQDDRQDGGKQFHRTSAPEFDYLTCRTVEANLGSLFPAAPIRIQSLSRIADHPINPY